MDGGTPVSAQNISRGMQASQPTPAPSKTGYVFSGWYKDANRSQIFDFSREIITADITIYAKWLLASISIELTHTGLHEVISRVISNGDMNVGLVVSYSSSAPVYNTIKDKSVFYKRSLVGETAMLVYLSVTDKTPESDASAFSKDATGNINNPEQFMMEDKDYYLYVYDIGAGTVIKTHAFHTLAMPTGAEIAALSASTGFGVSTFPGGETSIGIRESERIMLPGRLGKASAGLSYERREAGTRTQPMTCNQAATICDPTSTGSMFGLKRFAGEVTAGSGFITNDVLIYIKDDGAKLGFWVYSDGSTTDVANLFTLVSIED